LDGSGEQEEALPESWLLQKRMQTDNSTTTATSRLSNGSGPSWPRSGQESMSSSGAYGEEDRLDDIACACDFCY
jgi:hypothetical protein